jgi:2,4-dienoyl-CoA reductase-like NADH-dependent reductase (Old Yellow Enzyme family)
MSVLFEETTLNGLTLKNRFVRSATFEGMAGAEGACTPQLKDLNVELAKGNVGLIITGYAYVNEIGKSRVAQSGIQSDDLIEGWIDHVRAVHDHGGAIVMQIAHAGCNSFVIPEGKNAVGPSAVEMPQGCMCRDMSVSEIAETVDDFVKSAVRAKKAGFDGVQLHGAHGYLISQFLSPFYNKRTDDYGGSLENRARFVLDVLRGIRAAVGDAYPVMIKINSDDGLEGGFIPDEMVQVAGWMEKEGIDAIEVSGGTHLSPEALSFSRKGIATEEKELYFKEAAALYQKKIRTPLMLVGGIRSLSVAAKAVEEGLAEYVSLCRPLIREPHLIKRWQSGDHARAICISCNECFKPVRAGEPLYCVAEEKMRKRK